MPRRPQSQGLRAREARANIRACESRAALIHERQSNWPRIKILKFALVFLTFNPAQSISFCSFGEIMRRLSCLLAIVTSVGVLAVSLRGPLAAADKPPVTLDEFFDSVEYNSVQISPDGAAVVIQTTRSDWEASRYRTDLWLYRVTGANVSSGGALIPLTQSGHEHSPQWSPDGRWIAFLSDRATKKSKGNSDGNDVGSSEKSEPP